MNKGQIGLLAAIIGGASIVVTIVGGFFYHTQQTNEKIGEVKSETRALREAVDTIKKDNAETRADIKLLLQEIRVKKTSDKEPYQDQDWINEPAR